MKKADLPSVAQAKRIASVWSGHSSVVNIMTQGRDGASPYIDPTTAALVKRGWLAPNGDLKFNEHGNQYQPHKLSGSALLALECFLSDTRIDLRDAS